MKDEKNESLCDTNVVLRIFLPMDQSSIESAGSFFLHRRTAITIRDENMKVKLSRRIPVELNALFALGFFCVIGND